MAHPKDWRFLFKRYRVVAFPFHVGASSQKMPSEDFTPLISRCSPENGKITILREKRIELIKWRKVELENLAVSHLLQKKN
jgi:hypothetical protein